MFTLLDNLLRAIYFFSHLTTPKRRISMLFVKKKNRNFRISVRLYVSFLWIKRSKNNKLCRFYRKIFLWLIRQDLSRLTLHVSCLRKVLTLWSIEKVWQQSQLRWGRSDGCCQWPPRTVNKINLISSGDQQQQKITGRSQQAR